MSSLNYEGNAVSVNTVAMIRRHQKASPAIVICDRDLIIFYQCVIPSSCLTDQGYQFGQCESFVKGFVVMETWFKVIFDVKQSCNQFCLIDRAFKDSSVEQNRTVGLV